MYLDRSSSAFSATRAGAGRIEAGLSPERSVLAQGATQRVEAARQALAAERLVLAQATPPPPRDTQAAAEQQAATLAQVRGGAQPAGAPANLSQPTATELALMSRAAYGIEAPPTGWTAASDTQLAQLGLTQSALTPRNSEFQAAVYVNQVGQQTRYVVAFRGSEMNRDDWTANFRQAAGLPTDHYNRALDLARQLVVPADAQLTMTGHSLGGGLASAAAIAAEVNAVTFNAAGLSNNTVAAARAEAGRDDGRVTATDIRAYFVKGEVLSALQDGGDRVAGALLGFYLGGGLGAAGGAALADAPEAYGTRIALDAVRPEGMPWWQAHTVNKHLMPYVLSSLAGR